MFKLNLKSSRPYWTVRIILFHFRRFSNNKYKEENSSTCPWSSFGSAFFFEKFLTCFLFVTPITGKITNNNVNMKNSLCAQVYFLFFSTMETYHSSFWILLKASLRAVIEATSTRENAWVMYRSKQCRLQAFIHQFLGCQLYRRPP